MRRLYLDIEQDQRILYWDLRLVNRQTYCQWDGHLMGPIHDELGVEQGGPNSSDHYKIYNNEQLVAAQDSGLGCVVGDELVAAVSQADDSLMFFCQQPWLLMVPLTNRKSTSLMFSVARLAQ